MHDRLLNDCLSFYIYCDSHAEISLNIKVITIFRFCDKLMLLCSYDKVKTVILNKI